MLVDADELKGSCTIILRAVTVSGAMLVPARLPYDLVERTVERILETTPAVQRVFYDQTPTPVGKERNFNKSKIKIRSHSAEAGCAPASAGFFRLRTRASKVRHQSTGKAAKTEDKLVKKYKTG